MKQMLAAVALMMSGLILMAAAVDSGLPYGYWDDPNASEGKAPHAWSSLEADLRPEACAQCHKPQFDAWKNSLHAHAYSSGLVGQFPDMEVEDANSCLQCHAPLAEQKYKDGKDMADSIRLRLQHAEGFARDAKLTDDAFPLRHAGVTCASCHVRGWQRFGPPPRSSSKASQAAGHQDTPSHGGFTATRDFEQSQFCASCHQFPASMAINGKPLENTIQEWQASSFSRQGVTCQQCHMPDRRHEFRGIHDPEMVRKGLDFSLAEREGEAVLAITSTWIGHAFPTYVTPEVIVHAEAMDATGKSLQTWQWEVVREVFYEDGWQERQDTRLMPGERREFVASPMPATVTHIRYQVQVIPDRFYKGVYESLLEGVLDKVAGKHIHLALKHADSNDYVLYEKVLRLTANP